MIDVGSSCGYHNWLVKQGPQQDGCEAIWIDVMGVNQVEMHAAQFSPDRSETSREHRYSMRGRSNLWNNQVSRVRDLKPSMEFHVGYCCEFIPRSLESDGRKVRHGRHNGYVGKRKK